MDELKRSETNNRIDIFTLVAIAITVGLSCCFLHEVVGHAGTSKLLGVKVTRITNAYARQRDATPTQKRLIAAAGIPTTMLFGIGALLLRRKRRDRQHNATDYFLWLFGYVNILSGANYMMFFAFMTFGDLNQVVADLPYENVFRTIIMIAGISTIVATICFAQKSLVSFAGGAADMRRRAFALTLIPYLVIGLINVGASLLLDSDDIPLPLLLISAGGATLGSNSVLLWLNCFVRRSGATPSLTLPRSYGWYLVGIISFGLHCMLARGVNF